MIKILGVFASVLCLTLLAPGMASAQTGYQLDSVSTSNPRPGGTVDVYANGYKPDSTATITLEPNPVLLATVAAGTNGVVNATVTIPANTSSGAYTIYVRGIDRAGAAKVTAFPITVGAGGGTEAGGGTAGLPATGVDIGLALGVAIIAVGVGATLLASTRRRAATV